MKKKINEVIEIEDSCEVVSISFFTIILYNFYILYLYVDIIIMLLLFNNL
jgi:hypothetical protein